MHRQRRLPRWLPPDNQMRDYQRVLVHLVASAEDAMLTALNAKNDAWYDGVTSALALVRAALDTRRASLRARTSGIGRSITKFNKKQMHKVMSKALGVDVLAAEPWLESELRTFEIEAEGVLETMSASTMSRVQKVVLEGLRNGDSLRTIATTLRSKMRMQKRKAMLAARAHVAAFNGRITQLRQESVGVREYVWRNAQDQRVRGNPAGLYPDAKHNHWNKEGKKYHWNKPPKDTGHPGSEYLCRCYAEPVLSDLL